MINFITFYLEHIGGYVLSPILSIIEEFAPHGVDFVATLKTAWTIIWLAITTILVVLLVVLIFVIWIIGIPFSPILAFPGMLMSWYLLRRDSERLKHDIENAEYTHYLDEIQVRINRTKEKFSHPYYQSFFADVEDSLSRRYTWLKLQNR